MGLNTQSTQTLPPDFFFSASEEESSDGLRDIITKKGYYLNNPKGNIKGNTAQNSCYPRSHPQTPAAGASVGTTFTHRGKRKNDWSSPVTGALAPPPPSPGGRVTGACPIVFKC